MRVVQYICWLILSRREYIHRKAATLYDIKYLRMYVVTDGILKLGKHGNDYNSSGINLEYGTSMEYKTMFVHYFTTSTILKKGLIIVTKTILSLWNYLQIFVKKFYYFRSLIFQLIPNIVWASPFLENHRSKQGQFCWKICSIISAYKPKYSRCDSVICKNY